MTTIYVGNTNVLELFRLKSVSENAYINDADVEVTIFDAAGDEVTIPPGTPEWTGWPVTLEYIPNSQGDYRAILHEALEFEAGKSYTAFIDANAGIQRAGHWEVPFIARTRRQ